MAWEDRTSRNLNGSSNGKLKARLSDGDDLDSPVGKSRVLSDRDFIQELQSSIMDREDVIRRLQFQLKTCEHQRDCLIHELQSEQRVNSQEQPQSRQLALYKNNVSELELRLKELMHDSEAQRMRLLKDHKKQLKSLDAEWNARLQESLDRLQQEHAHEVQQLRKDIDGRVKESEHSLRQCDLDSTVAVTKLRHEHESHKEELSRIKASMNDQQIAAEEKLSKAKKELRRLRVETSAIVEEKDQLLLSAHGEVASLKEEIEQMRFAADQHAANETVEVSKLRHEHESHKEELSRIKALMKDQQIAAQEELSKKERELQCLQVETSAIVEEKDRLLHAAHGEGTSLKEEIKHMSEVASLLKQEVESMRRAAEQPSVDGRIFTHDTPSSPGAVRCTNPSCLALNMISLDGPPFVQCGSCGLDIEFHLGVRDISETGSVSTTLAQNDSNALNEGFGGLELGTYQIIRAAIVKERPEIDSEKVADVFPDVFVHVLEVEDFEDRVRARIEQPPGWISLVNKNTGAIYAEMVTTRPSLEQSPRAIPSLVEKKNPMVQQSCCNLSAIHETPHGEEEEAMPQTLDCEIEQCQRNHEAAVEVDIIQIDLVGDLALS